MKKKESHPPESPQLNFIHRFIQRCYERRQIDQESFISFNKFIVIYGSDIKAQTTKEEISGLICVVNTVFRNYEQFNKKKSLYQLYIQLFESYMNILEKMVSIKISNQILYDMIEVFWPLHQPNKKQNSFQQIEKKIKKMKISPQIQSSISKNSNVKSLPPIWSSQKYETFISYLLKEYGKNDLLEYFIRSFLRVQGQRYLDIILQLLSHTIQDQDINTFNKILKIYSLIASNHMTMMTHIEAMVNKILRSRKKVTFFSYIASQICLQKCYMPDHLLWVSLNILQAIFNQCIVNDRSLAALKNISSYRYQFSKATKVVDVEKLLQLPVAMLKLLYNGKQKSSPSKPPSKRAKSRSLSKNRSKSKPKKVREQVFKRPELEDNKQKDNLGLISDVLGGKAFGLSELQKLLIVSQPNQDDKKNSQGKEDSSDQGSSQIQKIRQSMLSKNQLQNYTELMKEILNNLMTSCKPAKTILAQQFSEKMSSQVYEMINGIKNVDSHTERFRYIVDFVIFAFPRLLNKNNHFKWNYNQEISQSGLMKLLKIKILEKNQMKSSNTQELFQDMYKSVHKALMAPTYGQNYHFFILHILHRKLSVIAPSVIKYLIDYMMKTQTDQVNKIASLGINLALINSLIEGWSNIKYSIPLMKDLTSKLTSKFSICDFINQSEIKQNSLFMSIQKHEDSDFENDEIDEEEKKIFDSIAQMLNKIIQKQSEISISEILGQMTNNNTEKSTFYFMIIIELNTLCSQKSSLKLNDSKDFESILQIKKNNRFGMMLTISNEIKSVLKRTLSQTEQTKINLAEVYAVIFHLFKRAEYLIQNPDQNKSAFGKGKQEQNHPNNMLIPQKTVKVLKSLILSYLYKISKNPSYRQLKLINRHINSQKDLNPNSLSHPADSIKLILDQKNRKFKTYIKDLQMIKFYAECIYDDQLLILMTVKVGLKIIDTLDQFIKKQNKQADKKDAMVQEQDQQSDRQLISQATFNNQLKQLRMVYDNSHTKLDEKERKMAEIFIKIKLLTYTHFNDPKKEAILSQPQIKSIIDILETNHEQLEEMLIGESNNKNLLVIINPKQQSFKDEWFFDTETGFMGYLLQNMLELKEKQVQANSLENNRQMYETFEISIMLLNMLKTLLENNPNILKLTQEHLLRKIDNPNKITDLIKGRTEFGMIRLMKSIEEHENIGVKKEEAKETSSKKKKQDNSSQAIKNYSRQIEDYVKLSRKIYKVLAKIFQIETDAKAIVIDVEKLITDIISLDPINCLPVSVYILREIINLAPIIHTHTKKQQMNNSSITTLAQIVFSHLMVVKENYAEIQLYSAIRQKRQSQMIDESQPIENTININNIVNYFIQQFFHLKLTDEYTTKTGKDKPRIDQKNLSKKNKFFCERNKKTVTFRCLACDQDCQICQNCAISCHENHPLIFIQNGYQLSKNCQCKQISNCKLINEAQQEAKKLARNARREEKEKRRQFVGIDFDDRVKEKLRGRSGYVMKKPLDPFEDPQPYVAYGGGYGDRFGEMIPPRFSANQPLPRGTYGAGYYREITQRERQRLEFERQKQRRQRGGIRQIHQQPMLVSYNNINNAWGGDNGYGLNPFVNEKYPQNYVINPEPQEEEQQTVQEFQEENYELAIQEEQVKQIEERANTLRKKFKNYEPLLSLSYLLPVFMSMMIQEVSEKKAIQNAVKKKQVSWFIKLEQPLRFNNSILANETNGNKNPVMRMCAPGTFQTKMRKPQNTFHPSPCISRKNFAVNQKFVIIISGLNINVYPKQKLLSYLQDCKNNSTSYQFLHQHQLQYEAHSIAITPDQNICTVGSHNITILSLQPQGSIQRHQLAKFSVNNDTINKVEVTNIGIFIGLSRQVRLLNFGLKQVASIKIPENLIKEFCCTVDPLSDNSYIVYITINDGYIFYAQINSSTQGVLYFKKKINDARLNRPVGSFVIVKEIQECGTLMFASYKDKSIGHCLGRLEGSTLHEVNYIKLFNQGIDSLFDSHFCMGLTDLVQSPNNSNQFYMIAIFKTEINDSLAVHRGILGIIKFTKEGKQITKYQVQTISNDIKCEYFSIVKLKDGGNQSKNPTNTGYPSWFILSIHEDGSLIITNPFKINQLALKSEIKVLKQKRLSMINKKISSISGVNNAQSNQNNSQVKDEFQDLRNVIKDHINIKIIKKNLSQLQANDHYQFFSSSEILKTKQDYVMAGFQNKNYEIRLTNFAKIITGISLPEQGDIILPTRTVTNVFDVGLTTEQSLYFYAFGVLKFTYKKLESQNYVRQGLKDQLQNMMNKKRGGQISIQEKYIFNQGSGNSTSKQTDILIYGESLMQSFKPRVIKSHPYIFTPSIKSEQLFSMRTDQKIELCLQTSDIFLTNCLASKNYEVTNQQQIIEFSRILRQNLIGNKNWLSSSSSDKKRYELVRSIMIKSLQILEKLQNRKFHIFNDEYHPVRYSTQSRIQFLYDALNKNEISDNDLIFLVNQLYRIGTVNEDINHLEQENKQMSEEPIVSSQSNRNLLAYYVAKYPAMLLKIHKKFKIIQKQGIIEKLIPLYLLGYLVLKYLKYHTQWVLPALCQAVGKQVSIQNETKPKFDCRKLLYKFLHEFENVQLEAWLKNVQGVDVHECMEEIPPIAKEPSNQGGGLAADLIGAMGGMGDMYMDDFEAQMKMAMELSKMEMKDNEPEQFFQEPQQEGNQLMEEIEIQQESDNINPLLKDIISECLKEVDFSSNSVDQNCQKVVVLYVVSKFTEQSHKKKSQERSLLFLFKQIRSVMVKITSNYQQAGNSNIHNILMLWMDFFGNIFKRAKPLLDKQSGEEYATYMQIKDSIMEVLKNKVRVEEIKKYQTIPKMLSRLFNGKKVSTKASLVYGLIRVLQPPCETIYVLLTLECYWLFPQNKDFYNKTKYTDTIRENEKLGNIQKIYDTAMTNIELWKSVGDPEWLMNWIEDKKLNWVKALQLLSMIYEQ